MPVFTYEFEDLDVGEGLIVGGAVDVVYQVEHDDLDVGFKGGIEYHLTDAVIETKSGDVLAVEEPSELFFRVERALLKHRSNNISEAAQKDYADDRDSGMDDPLF